MTEVKVTSHVGRDLLQSANIFKTGEVAIWEYVVNSAQYVTTGTSPIVTVDVNNKNKTVEVCDNGRGMDLDDLNNFFTMHGENVDRKVGKGGRGKFGTGKSAAFGIAHKLTVSSTKNGVRNTVSLHRKDIDNSDGAEIPVKIVESNVKSDSDISGTTVIIEEVFVNKIDSSKIIKQIEKHLQSFRSLNPQILVGDHVCSYKEPSFGEVKRYYPTEKIASIIGDVELVVKVSQGPLSVDERGVLVSCGPGSLVAIEDGGVCSKEMGEYLFGEIDVPNIDSEEYEMEAYDSSRDMKLRQEHQVAVALTVFIGTSLEEVRKELVKQKRESLKSEESKRLKEQADKIADLLNKDFKEVNDKILQIRSATSSFGKRISNVPALQEQDNEDDGWVSGLEERGVIEGTQFPDLEPNPTPTPKPVDPKPGPDSDPSIGQLDDEGNASLDASAEDYKKKSMRPRGGFKVGYKHMGADQDRATYTADKGVFTVNLDHAVVKIALKNLGTGDIEFQRLSYEIIFAEYALALANMAAVDDPDIPADDVIYDARETLNRISAKSAILYEI